MTHEQIVAALQDRNLRRVAENTGLHHNTLVRLRKGHVVPNPGTIHLLSVYLSGGNNA